VALSPLPIDAFLPAIVESLTHRRALVLAAEPGVGKTTRVPRALMLSGKFDAGEILVLEPRRIAARMAAHRVAEELDEKVGQRIGYTVRFDEVSSAKTRVRFVTEGILTRRLVQDPMLEGVSVVVLDELHERSLHADLALAMLRKLRAEKRPELALVAMSATLDADEVGRFLDAEVVRVPGRAHEIVIDFAKERDTRPLEAQVASACARALREEPDGHVLVFLPGAGEIRKCEEALASLASRENVDLVPLHGDLPPDAQDRAVRPSSKRKIILATNVAETSLTIDGVTTVVDSGLHRMARHSPWSGLPILELAPISQASATQRAGRAGRTRAGRAVRLYLQHDYAQRPRFDVAEILRVDLAETVLSLASLGVTNVAAFPFFEAPPLAAVQAATDLLARLGAIDSVGAITREGRAMLALPIHPRLGKIVLAARDAGLERDGALLAATLAEREIRAALRTRFGERERAASQSGTSDAMERLEAIASAEQEGLSRASLSFHGLDPGASNAVVRLRDQIVRALSRVRLDVRRDESRDVETALLRAILAGYPDRVGKRRKKNGDEVVLAGGGSARLAESSVVRDAELLVCVEAEEKTGKVLCRIASMIEPEWLLELFPDRVKDLREVRFDPEKERIELVTALTYDGIAIDESRGDAAGVEGAAAVLAGAALSRDLGRFVDRDALAQLRLRLDLARRADPSLPVLDDTLVKEALTAACEGRRSFDELAKADVLGAILATLGTRVRSRLDQLAPTEVALPARKNKVTYEVDRPPWVESRMQDFFGLLEGPRAGGEPIVLHLLAPNMRAVQVTTDLAGFWDRHYPKLKKELMRQYPRHYWPDDPRTAEPRKPLPRKPR
jgi:ATP-dependent helicase HrpB